MEIEKITANEITRDLDNVRDYRVVGSQLFFDMKDDSSKIFACSHCGGTEHYIKHSGNEIVAACYECGRPSGVINFQKK